MDRRERVVRAIEFDGPDRAPLWLFNRDQEDGDILWYDFRISEGEQRTGYHGSSLSEWGYEWRTQDDGTMGQPTEPVIATWDDLDRYQFPTVNADKRLAAFDEFQKKSEDHYRLPLLIITGFMTYTFLRGFENAVVDLLTEPERSGQLLDGIFEAEDNLITLAAEIGMDGFHFGDDWGTQDGLIISPELWRKAFKPRYRAQFEHAHRLGLHVWFHSCGNVASILPDLHEIGVDVMNISQPNVVDIPDVGRQLKGKQCFLMPLSYQTVSITGTPEEIAQEAQRLCDLLGTEEGGFIGYLEEYSCMGMSEENYDASRRALQSLK